MFLKRNEHMMIYVLLEERLDLWNISLIFFYITCELWCVKKSHFKTRILAHVLWIIYVIIWLTHCGYSSLVLNHGFGGWFTCDIHLFIHMLFIHLSVLIILHKFVMLPTVNWHPLSTNLMQRQDGHHFAINMLTYSWIMFALSLTFFWRL